MPCFGNGLVEQGDAVGKGAQEGVFLLLDDARDELLLGFQFGIGVAHFVYEHGNELEHECLLLIEEGVGIAHGAAQDAAYDVARLGVAGQLSVGNGEAHGAYVVGDDAHGDVGVLLCAVFHF